MAELYGRVVEVLVGPKGGEGRLITDLRIAFKVEKSIIPQPNTAEVAISNLSPETRAICETQGAVIILRAGYGTYVKTLFQGDIALVETKVAGSELITRIEAGDGESEYRLARADISYGPGAKYGQVFDALAGALGLAKGSVIIPNPADQFLQGYAGSGTVRQQMDDLANRQGLEWSIQDGQLQMLPPDTPTADDAILISPETGLIGSPFKTKILRPELAKNAQQALMAGVKVTCLLNPDIRPGRRVQVESQLVSGLYKVQKVTQQGDTHGPAFYSEVEAK